LATLGLSPKLRLAPLWTALAALLTAAVLLWGLLPTLFTETASNELLEASGLLAPLVRQRMAAAPPSIWIHELAGQDELRVTLIAATGTILGDTETDPAAGFSASVHPLPTIESGENPEVRDALTSASGTGTAIREIATTGESSVFVARRFVGPRGDTYVLRLAEPLSGLARLRHHVAATLAFAALAALVAVVFTALWLDWRLFRPLASLIHGASELAAGTERRVEVPAGDELAALATSLNRLAETAESQYAAMRKERDQLQIILASMSEGVLVIGATGRALLANPAFRRLFDLPLEITGKPLLELVRRPELARLLDKTLSTGEPQTGQVELQGPDRRSLFLASAALSGGEHGAVVVARDTTELTRLADMRRDFVANVSHELKTPLSAIRGYAETLRDGALEETETARRFTDRILWQCQRLQALLTDLLTLSRIESVALPAEREPVDIRQIARRTIELLSASAQEKGVTVSLQDGEPGVVVPGDADGLERLVVNLIDNAIKYNQRGGSVNLRVERTADSALLQVTDDGIGIPADSLPRIFERFYRVDKGRSREEGGTGLGLAIVKHVVQAHGGAIEVESKPGRGTTFRVRIPLAPSEANVAPRT
jgi:two-component system phosphate regulon sensor histidine kinase PhoR